MFICILHVHFFTNITRFLIKLQKKHFFLHFTITDTSWKFVDKYSTPSQKVFPLHPCSVSLRYVKIMTVTEKLFYNRVYTYT